MSTTLTSPFGPDPITTEPFVVAFLLNKAQTERPRGFTPLQINKLAYICHGWTLAGLDRPLFNNSYKQIQAWKYGPVVVGIYEMLKKFGRSSVTLNKLKESNIPNRGLSTYNNNFDSVIKQDVTDVLTQRPELSQALHWVFDVYAEYTGGELINMTHEPGSPWDQCRARGIERLFLASGGSHVPDNVIRSYYRDLGNRIQMWA